MEAFMKTLIIVALFLLTSVTANATNWLWVANNDRGEAYIDVDSVSPSGYSTKALTKYEYFQTRPLTGTDGFNKTLLLEEFYCDNDPKAYKTLYTKAYLNDLEVAIDEQGELAEQSIVQPDTMASVKFDIVCYISRINSV